MKTKERPMLFSGPMVKAILEGKKTQTRRVVKFKKPFERHSQWPYMKPHSKGGWIFADAPIRKKMEHKDGGKLCPYGLIWDRLWVRETWQEFDGEIIYKSAHELTSNIPVLEMSPKWKPSIHMPRWVSRINLEIKAIRVEKLHSLSKADAKREGMKTLYPVMAFRNLWTDLNGPRGFGWTTNPWVWVITFKRILTNASR